MKPSFPVIVFSALVAIVAASVMWFYGATIKDAYSSLSEGWKLAVPALIISILALLISILTLLFEWYKRRERKSERPFLYDLVSSADELNSYMGIPVDRLEIYIKRQQLLDAWQTNLVPPSNKLILCGASGVGKSREAIELIKRISKVDKRQVAYKQFRAVPPTHSSPHLADRVVLFIDDLKLEKGVETERNEEEVTDDEIGKELQRTVRFFEKKCQTLMVVLTMQKQQFEALKSSRRGFVDEFHVIELNEMQTDERLLYAREQSQKLGCSANDANALEALVRNDVRSLPYMFYFFDKLRAEGKNEFGVEDVNVYSGLWKERSKKVFESTLTANQLSILQALSCLRGLEIEAKIPVVKHLFFRMSPSPPSFRGRTSQFNNALKYLSKRCLTVNNNVVHVGDYLLDLRDSKDLKRELALVTDAVLDLSRKRFFRRREIDVSNAVELLNVVTNRLNSQRQRPRALEVAAVARSLKPNDSRAMFQTGLILQAMGSSDLQMVEHWFQRALDLEPEPKYASHISHALASLWLKSGRRSEALAMLDKAHAADPDDVLTLMLTSKIRRDFEVSSKAAIETYRKLRKRLKNCDADLPERLGGEFECVLFLVAYKRNRRKPARALLKLMQLIRVSLPTASLSARTRLTTAHKLSNFCFENARLDEKNRLSYLHHAQFYLEHAIAAAPHSVTPRLAWAQLHNYLKDWDTVEETVYWQEVNEILDLFYQALRPAEAPLATLYNAKVHYSAASFLWHVERKAYGRKLERPASYAGAESEFEKAIPADQILQGEASQDLYEHVAMAYLNFGEYLMTVSGRNIEQRQKAHTLISKSLKLAKEHKLAFEVESDNSYVQSYVAELLLKDGDLETAKTHLKKAIKLLHHNAHAWRLSGEIAESERDFRGAVSYYETSADLRRSPQLYTVARNVRRRLTDAGLLDKDPSASLRLSRKAYELDPNGEISISHIINCAYDEQMLAKSCNDKEGFLRAKDLFIKAAEKLRAVGNSRKANSLIWAASECIEGSEGKVDGA